MNYLMHTGYFFTIVFIIFPLIGFFIYIFYFNKYIFDKKSLNYFLVFNMFFGSPIGILGAIAFGGIRGINISNFEILKFYIGALIIITIIGSIKYAVWYVFFRRETNNLLIYSKKFILQMPYLILWFYPWWELHDSDFAMGLVPSMIISEIIVFFSVVIISIHQSYNKKNEK